MPSLHGLTKTPEYYSLASAVQRCNPNNSDRYPRYAGRGIKVCPRWYTQGVFKGEPGTLHIHVFLEDLGPRPKGKTLDRIDSDGDYTPENCRWATAEEQANNTCRVVLLDFKGETLSLSQWARRFGVHPSTMWQRWKLGWSVERVLSPELRGSGLHEWNGNLLHLKEIAELEEVNVGLLYYHTGVGKTVEEAVRRAIRWAEKGGSPKDRLWTGRGKTMTLGEWSRVTGLSVTVLESRIASGQGEERVLEPTLRMVKRQLQELK